MTCRVIGNAILNSARVSGYTTNANAAAIGATGACIASLIVGSLLQCFLPRESRISKPVDDIQDEQEQPLPLYITFFIIFLIHMLGGVIGWAILRHNHVDLGVLDADHAARAAALGSLMFSVLFLVGMMLAGPIILGAIAIVLSPLFIAMTMGLKWVYIRSSSTWEQKGNWTYSKYSSCYCYGFCERDEEIDAELAKIGHWFFY